MRKAKLAQENRRFFCHITGAHFEYEELCRRLEKFRIIRIFSQKLAKQRTKPLKKKKKKKRLPVGIPLTEEKSNEPKLQPSREPEIQISPSVTKTAALLTNKKLDELYGAPRQWSSLSVHKDANFDIKSSREPSRGVSPDLDDEYDEEDDEENKKFNSPA